MNWLNLELTTLRSEEYLGSEPIQRATWLNLLAYCADQENSGVIKNCADWGSRRWLQLLGITKEEVLSASDLWTWKGDDLHVWKYPKAKEAEVRRKREQGKKGGRPPKTKDEKPDGSPDAKPDGSILQKRNRKGKEEEVEGNKNQKKLIDFERVWMSYGRKGNKQSARRYWVKLSSADCEAIEAKIPEYLKSRPDVQFRSDFSGWINPKNRKWEDEIVNNEQTATEYNPNDGEGFML